MAAGVYYLCCKYNLSVSIDLFQFPDFKACCRVKKEKEGRTEGVQIVHGFKQMTE